VNAENPYRYSGAGEAQPAAPAPASLDERVRKVVLTLLLIAAGGMVGSVAGTIVGLVTGLIEFRC
jgi:hypothetical protein